MKVLIVTHHYLSDNGGGSFASRSFINAFSEIASQCYLLYPDDGIDIYPFINNKCKSNGVKWRSSNFMKLIDVFMGKINRYTRILPEIIKEFNPDLVVFDNSRVSAALIKKVKRQGIRTITIHHNYEMEYYQGTPPPLLLRFPFMHYMKRAEMNAIKYSDLNLTLTVEDIELLKLHYDTSHKCAFECIGIFEYRKGRHNFASPITKDQEGKSLCFIISGSLSAYQTEISLIPFLKNYYPKLLNLYPESQMIITGKNPTDKIVNLCKNYPNIKLIANPVNIQEEIIKGDIYICPISVGGGLKLRIMDGLKMGLPVLTHEISARGYQKFIQNGLLFSYNDITSFEKELQKVVSLYKNQKQLGLSVQELYRNIFLFESGITRLKRILTDYHF